jgi:hypothetical protein
MRDRNAARVCGLCGADLSEPGSRGKHFWGNECPKPKGQSELKPCDRWKPGPGETFVLKAGVFDCIACPDGRWSILVRPLGSRFPEVVVRASKDEDLPQSLVHAQLACEGVFRCLLAEACGWIEGCCP